MNKKHALIAASVVLVSFTGWSRDVFEKEEIKKTLKFAETKGSRRLMIDNTHGSITVTGYDGEEVQLLAHKSVKAESNEKLAEAREDVTLDIKEQRDRIEIFVDAPWRTAHGINDRGYRWYGYEVQFDFEIKVPRKTSIFLKTVDDGEIVAQDIEGDFEIQNVNGGIEMLGIAGSGKAVTVNGSVKAVFRKNPESNCSFHTINGKVEAVFQDKLSADLLLKTFNGKVYTDYEVTDLPKKSPVQESGRKKKVYRSGDSFAVRVGNGGPTLAFDTLNGNIYITKQE